MKTKAKVLSVNGSSALVEVERTSACEGCHKTESGSCSVCTLMGSGNKKTTVSAENRIGAKEGDLVWVESSTRRMLLYAACLFLLPLVLFAAGFGAAAAFTETQWIRMIAGLCGILIAFVGVAIYSKTVAAKRKDVEIVGVIPTKEDSEKDS